ncbi:MAG TPA: hypothetical protein VLW54_00455 [Candidatus Acidoferrales bacterium]|nr:hypothetical protein [Candidatus Acidoferrales bacterium]
MDTNPSPEKHGGYETRDANVRNLLRIAGVLLMTLLVAAGAAKLAYDFFGHVQKLGPPPTPFEQARALPPLPQLQANPESDLEKLREQDRQELNSYGWVDRTRGIIHIPIERAMELLLERGLPTRPSGAAGAEKGAGQPAARGQEAARGGASAPQADFATHGRKEEP